MTTLEAFRVLVSNNFRPLHAVEFHWYSAEEQGLYGSQAVATEYHQNAVPVIGMMQLDMTGYTNPNEKEHIGVMTDFTSPQLTAFLRQLITTYCSIPYRNTTCGYACSDHASWNKLGYLSVFPTEADFKVTSPYIHSAKDTVDHVSLSHMAEFVKLAIAYTVEYAGWA
jgi:leucyl aminopeptidase